MNKIKLTLNFHFWKPCNFRCKFCFATFEEGKARLPKGHLPKADSLRLLEMAAEFGFYKVNFVGGEPTLCPWLPELLKHAKVLGLKTSIVTNGSRLTPRYLDEILPWLDQLGISIDSLHPATNTAIGRLQPNGTTGEVDVWDRNVLLAIGERVRAAGVSLKVNTVVNSKNWQESDMGTFIDEMQPGRWKRFQVLKKLGENEEGFDEFGITVLQYKDYCNRNAVQNPEVRVVDEGNDVMLDSYIMMNPEGRLFSNQVHQNLMSAPVLEAGFDAAFSSIYFDEQKYIDRDANYALDEQRRRLLAS